MRITPWTRWTWLPAAIVLTLGGCEPRISPEVQAQLASLDTVAAQRDSLFNEVADNARLLNELNAEVDKVEGLRGLDSTAAESPISEQRGALRAKVQQVIARLQESEKRLATSRAQLERTRKDADTLKTRVASLEQVVVGLEEMLESQRTTITSLTERVGFLEGENLALRDTVTTMETRHSRAYYVVGTKEELLERGLINKEGGSRVLFIFGKAGQTLVPARELDPSQFTEIDMRRVTEIPLPDSTAEYIIASRQDLTYLAEPPQENGRVRGAIRIGAPEQFWQPSKFLIIVRS